MLTGVSMYGKCYALAQDLMKTFFGLGDDVKYGSAHACAVVGMIGFAVIAVISCILPASPEQRNVNINITYAGTEGGGAKEAKQVAGEANKV